MIVRITILGRDAKVELHDASGAEIVALMTRDRFDESGFWRGQTVWVQPEARARLRRRPRVGALEERRDALADADAQRREPVATVAAAQLVQQRDDEPRAAHPERMAERDRAAVDVHLLLVEAELADRRRGSATRRPRSARRDRAALASIPARSSSLRTAGIGPMPMTRGSTPATAERDERAERLDRRARAPSPRSRSRAPPRRR